MVELPPETEPEPATQSGPPAADDPHRAETVAQVLEFVDRLGTSSAADQQVPPPERSSPGASAAERSAQPAPLAAAMTANAPADVTDLPDQGEHAPYENDAPDLPAKPVIASVFIPGEVAEENPPPPADNASAANSPLSTDPPQHDLSLEQLVETLAKRVSASPDDAAAQWKLRLLQLVVGDEDAARDAPPDTADDHATVLRELVDLIVATRDALENPVTASDTALAAANTLQTTLSEQADLQIPSVALCTRVATFGVYDEMPSETLIPYRANRAIVYIEVANFFSETTTARQYRTALSGEFEVLTAAGQPVWEHSEPNIVDISRQRRHDFFLAQLITLPPTLGPGQYVLKVTIQDELSGKSNQAIHPFSVGSTSVANASP